MSNFSEFYVAVPRELLNSSFDSSSTVSDESMDSQSSVSSEVFSTVGVDLTNFLTPDSASDDDLYESVEVDELELVTDSDTSVPDVESIGVSYLERFEAPVWRRRRYTTSSRSRRSLRRFASIVTSPAREDIIIIQPGNDVGSNSELDDVGDSDAGREGELWFLDPANSESEKLSTCVECGRDVVGPRFHHCRKCWTKWKSYYSTLGKRRFSKKVKRLGKTSHAGGSESGFESMPSTSSGITRRDSQTSSSSAFSQSSQESSTTMCTDTDDEDDDTCVRCGVGPAEISLEHTSVLHQCVCQPCSKALMKLPKAKRKCPLCRRRFVNALHVFR